MPGPCALDSLQLLCGSDSFDHGVFRNFGIYACHTPVVELESTFENNYAGNTPKSAMTRDTLVVQWQNSQWSGFGFDPRFDYNGADNLILEFRWQGDDGNAAYDRGWYTPGNRAVDGRSLTAPKGTPRDYMPRLRIFYSLTGVEEKKGMSAGSPWPRPTIVRGILEIPDENRDRPGHRGTKPRGKYLVFALLDARGREVLDLHAGANDVSRLAPGVYFVRGQGFGARGQSAEAEAMTRVVIVK
jgi:hypothetical protein